MASTSSSSLRLGTSLVLAVSLAAASARAETPAPAADGSGDGVFPKPGVAMGGAVGVGRLTSADAGRPGTVRVGVRGGFFRGTDFPSSGTNTQLSGELTAGYTLLQGVEVFGAYRNSSNDNSAAAPHLVQAQGDLLLGAKAGTYLGSTAVAGDLRFDLRNGIGSDALSTSGSTVQLRALASQPFTLGGRSLLVSANVGTALGKASAALDPRMTDALLYGTGFSAYHRVLGAVGVQAPLGRFTPYAVLDLDVPLGVATEDLAAKTTTTFGAASKRLALGTRIGAGSAGAFDVTAEIGSGTGVRGYARTEPWMLSAGYSFAFDSALYQPPAPPTVVEREPAPVAPATGTIGGQVFDLAKGSPVAGAIVSIEGAKDLLPVASDPAGRFQTGSLPPGPVTLKIEREGFKPVTFEARVAAGRAAPAEIRLEALPPAAPLTPPPAPAPVVEKPAGWVAGHLDAAGGHAEALVRFAGPQKEEVRTEADGSFSLKLAPGSYAVTILPETHFARQATLTVAADRAQALVAHLEARPAKSALKIDGDKVTLAKALTLDEKKPDVAPADLGTLAELADLLVREPGKKLVLAVHSEPGKKKTDDRTLWTEQRAEALRKALVAQGAPAERVEAKGFGSSKPLGPKASPKDRRVELTLAGAAPAPLEAKPAAPAPAEKPAPVAPAAAPAVQKPTVAAPEVVKPAAITPAAAPEVVKPAPITPAAPQTVEKPAAITPAASPAPVKPAPITPAASQEVVKPAPITPAAPQEVVKPAAAAPAPAPAIAKPAPIAPVAAPVEAKPAPVAPVAAPVVAKPAAPAPVVAPAPAAEKPAAPVVAPAPVPAAEKPAAPAVAPAAAPAPAAKPATAKPDELQLDLPDLELPPLD